MFLVILEHMTKEQSAWSHLLKLKARSPEKVTDVSGLTVMIIRKRAFARIAFPLYVALVLAGYWSAVSRSLPSMCSCFRPAITTFYSYRDDSTINSSRLVT